MALEYRWRCFGNDHCFAPLLRGFFMPEKYEKDIVSYINKYQLDKVISFDDNKPDRGIYDSVDPDNAVPFAPDWYDLVRLHKLVLDRKVTTILEFGTGKSTIILSHALNINRELHAEYVEKNMRRSNPFELHSVDADADFIRFSQANIPNELSERTFLHHSGVMMSEFNGRICTVYSKLPNICPDFIYLDAPGQFCPSGDIRNITTAHPDRLPMSADLLAIEHFLLPGTFILVDGRTANARFLECNFQRNWVYNYHTSSDIHTFELMEEPLGKYNKAQIEYCLGNEWLNSIP